MSEPLSKEQLARRRDVLWADYRDCMTMGTGYQRLATQMVNESEPAAEQYVEMRKVYRRRHGPDGFGDAVNDFMYSQMSEAKKAVGDNQWYMQRATMFANLAQMEFAKAGVLMQHIVRIESRL